MKKRIFFKTIILVLIIGMPFIVNSKNNSKESILIPVKKGATWGYVSPNSEKEIPCIYDGALDFSEGLAAVKKGDKWGVINRKGETVIKFIYDAIRWP